jgi:hypothetical protein
MPSTVPATTSGSMRLTSAFTVFCGSANPMRHALVQSSKANIASANGSDTRCVASGIVTSAAPNPVIPKMIAPANAIVPSAASVP